jgi:hypothetical protein
MKRVYYEVEKKIETISKKGYVEVDDNYTQMYDSLSKLSFKMKSLVENQFLFFACTHANDEGVFLSDERMFNRFNKYAEENGGKSVNRATFTRSIQNLTESKIFIKLNRGQYQLNPFLLWRDSVTERTNVLTTICESKDKEKYMLNEPEITYRPTYKID